MTNDPIIGKVTVEVATYMQKEGLGEVKAKDFKATTMDLGVLTRDTGNHIFKFLADHMLSQSEKDSKEKGNWKRLVVTMAKYFIP